MSTRSLPVLMPRTQGQRWSCHSCARCCYDLVGHLSADERQRIDRQDWGTELGLPPYVRMGRAYVLNKHEDGACVFLDRQTRLCRIHVKFGEQAKPLACRIYPFTVRPVAGGWQVAYRFDCPSMASAEGTPILEHRAALAELTDTLPHPGAIAEEEPVLYDSARLTPQQTRRLIERITAVMSDGEAQLTDRLRRLAWACGTLADSRLDRVGLERFDELADMVFGSAPAAQDFADGRQATPAQLAMLRELVFAHAEHVTIQEMTASLPARLARRWRQLRLAGRFRRGRGALPPVRGLQTCATFEEADAVRAADAPDMIVRITRLLERYVVARFEARSVFGPGYYDWAVADGLRAFMASLAALGWLARAAAAGAGRTSLAYEDVFEALRVIDRSAGRSPALRTRAERLRVRFLARDGGLPKLLGRYALV